MKIKLYISLHLISINLLFIQCSQLKNPLPDKVNNLQLVKLIEGEEAKQYINKLHFQPVTDNENFIAFYKDLSGSAIVYLTLYPDIERALNDFQKMTKKISPENSVFTSPEFFTYRGEVIYKCLGMGMVHYVFVKNKSLYWVSEDFHLADSFFKSFYQLTY